MPALSVFTILEQMVGIPAVRGIVLAGREGLPIEAAPRGMPDAEALAALGAAALSAAESLAVETHRADLVGVILEYQDGLVCIEPLGNFAVAVAPIDAAAALVPLRQYLRQVQGDLLEALDAR